VCVFVSVYSEDKTHLRMPEVTVEKGETYLCHALPLDNAREHWLTGFEPHSSMHTAHHMLMYGCERPGSEEDVWNCGEMHTSDDLSYSSAPVCADGSQIIYAWARDAPALTLPEGVGFKVGGETKVQYVVLQVHYMHPMPKDHPDSSGITLTSTDEPMPKTAATMLMATGGKMKAQSSENFETACVIDEQVTLHPFAFRTHAHSRGKVVSGWKVTKMPSGNHKWELIGKRDPMDPEMFYPVADSSMLISENDIIAARCHMVNNEDREIAIGSTNADEMCNFYMMYWVDGDNVLSDNQCVSDGPPSYYWDKEAGLTNIPDHAANTL